MNLAYPPAKHVKIRVVIPALLAFQTNTIYPRILNVFLATNYAKPVMNRMEMFVCHAKIINI